jgi:hypothetical protein
MGNLLNPLGTVAGRDLQGYVCHKSLRAAIMLHTNSDGLRLNLHMARDGCDQIISKGIKFRRRQVRAIMNEDQLQTLFGALCTVFLSE